MKDTSAQIRRATNWIQRNSKVRDFVWRDKLHGLHGSTNLFGYVATPPENTKAAIYQAAEVSDVWQDRRWLSCLPGLRQALPPPVGSLASMRGRRKSLAVAVRRLAWYGGQFCRTSSGCEGENLDRSIRLSTKESESCASCLAPE